ncbi:hypothetical protein [Streptomyces sp. NBC_01803]|uniref:hypothetical protein n=1 Tax=Streptomyces sp. NBC_01803 TaxID=2975946 RepID=UPI002DDC0A3D|nr:hypothetical protein [Streptomyces sp. NBC_01803]WSA44517.1 hypothetical protein OIE51_10055 [Streptomyces sp. NBC_01803]
MSAISVILLMAAGTAVALGTGALHTARGLRAEVAALRAELAGRTVPAARPVPAEEIRCAVSAALADERERELAEARAYWAEQDAREDDGPAALLGGRGFGYEVAEADEELLDALLERYLLSDSGFPAGGTGRDGGVLMARQPGDDAESGAAPTEAGAGAGAELGAESSAESGESAELAAARRRHPSHPGFTLSGEPIDRAAADRSARDEHRRTTDRLARLAEARIPLADVRQGPLGTLDVFLFADGTTLCLSPSHQEAAERLAAAVRAGQQPVLMGGSGVSGAYALTFSCGSDSVYLLADRVVASSHLSE